MDQGCERGETAHRRWRGPGAGLHWQGRSFPLGLELDGSISSLPTLLLSTRPAMPGGAGEGEGAAVARKALARAGGCLRPLCGALGPGPSSRVSTLSRERGCRQRPGRVTGKGTARTKRPRWARRELGEEHRSQLKRTRVAESLHSREGPPCVESGAPPVEKRKAPRSHFSYSGCLPGPRAFPKGGREGWGPLGEEKRGRRCLGMQGQL